MDCWRAGHVICGCRKQGSSCSCKRPRTLLRMPKPRLGPSSSTGGFLRRETVIECFPGPVRGSSCEPHLRSPGSPAAHRLGGRDGHRPASGHGAPALNSPEAGLVELEPSGRAAPAPLAIGVPSARPRHRAPFAPPPAAWTPEADPTCARLR